MIVVDILILHERKEEVYREKLKPRPFHKNIYIRVTVIIQVIIIIIK